MNLDNIKTKGIIDENRFNDLSESISEAILKMRYLSKPDIYRLIKTQMAIFYEKQHEAKLRLKLRQTEDNMAEMRLKTKEHNVKMTFQTNFWKYKYKDTVSTDIFNHVIEELKALEENQKVSNSTH